MDEGTVLEATVECGKCGLEYPGRWPQASKQEDQADAPVADQVCPGCSNVQAEQYPGVWFMTEAG
jgi:hypothetical protein